MRDLARSLHVTGRPVPVPWRHLAQWIRPRTGDLVLVLAAGGVGKSAFSLDWVMRLNAPALYVSLDTSLVDHGIRVLARSTGASVEDIVKTSDTDPTAWAKTWGSQLEDIDEPVRFCDRAYSVREVDELVVAETEYWGDSPTMTIVDNLSNLQEREEGAGEFRRILAGLHRVAKERDTCIMALHHIRKKPAKASKKDDEEPEDEGTMPVHLSDALYEGDKEAQIVLGLWRPVWNQMAVGVLKNRMGPASRVGSMHTTLDADLRYMRIEQPGRSPALLGGYG